ncbi:MAG: CotH kinase family protein, partial [Kiritimatiellae bacterium]|nr:CotH kinase family protein [Kiritimatiellia bacterium]
MARNDSTITDEDLDYSDWIELKNTSSDAINLAGWYLTDDANNLNKWQFPATDILPGAYLIVFASDKDRSIAGSELHTNFKLSGDGEYLAIVEANGTTIAHEYTPSFPPQLDDLSYGFVGGAADLTLIGDEAPCSAFVPTDDSEGNNWLLTGFNDSEWTFGTLGVGYDTGTLYESLFDVDLQEYMYEINASAYIRVPFVVPADSSVLSLSLRMKYDDGFIAYINGVEVVRSANAPQSPTWNSGATVIHSDTLALQFEDFDISAYKHLLTAGQNILAIHALNCPAKSSDLLFVPELKCRISSDAASTETGYLEDPTPGNANTTEILIGSEAVIISVPGKLCSGSVIVQISAPDSVEKIYYTLDGSEPSATSAEYTGSITIDATTSLRARSFETGQALGPISTETYLFLDSAVQNFTSDLPIVIVDNLGGGDIPDTSSQSAFMAFFKQGSDGRTRLTNNFVLSTRAGIRRRGETSKRATNRKPNLAIETWGADSNEDVKIAPLGMPSESDWILWAPWHFDPAGIRNSLIYALSNQTDNYAVRTRFVEVFLNAYGSDITMDDYAGLYLFEEKIKRDNDRVDVESMTTLDNEEPEVTGGYILRLDKEDPDQNQIEGTSQSRLYCIYPQPDEITAAQENYISNYIINFESQLSNPDPLTGYQAYIDTDDFIDHFMLNLLTKNADGLVFSTYMHKPRNGKLSMGPIWDFDRSQESTDSRDDDPLGWKYTTYTWWKNLFQNADFWQQYIDRWQELRGNVLSNTNLTATIDMMAAEIAEAKARDITRWTGFSDNTIYTTPRIGSNELDGTQQGEVNHMKWWLLTRMDWMDSQLIDRPVFSNPGGAITTSIQLTITAPTGTTIYYTLDGSDPRAAGGLPSVSATAYTSALTVQPNSFIQARAWDGTTWNSTPPDETPWSGPVKAIFPQSEPALFLTEVHYNPEAPDPTSIFNNDDFEFIELQNITQDSLNLRGYALDGSIEFAFSDSSVELLPPGEYVVVVRNREAFATRYNTNDISIAGEYSNKLSNSGEDIRLEFYGQQLFEIAYDDARGWPVAADGGGHSLIPINDAVNAQGFDILDYPGNWRASTYINGSPGEADPEPLESLMINELTAHTDTGLEPPFDSNDQIELYNPTAAAITLDVYWYLSDDLSDPQKWNIPTGTIIPPGGWVLFDEDDFHPERITGFGLDKAGENLMLSHIPGSALDRIADCVAFKGQTNGASLGRYPDGNAWFQTLTPTPGTANQLPSPG